MGTCACKKEGDGVGRGAEGEGERGSQPGSMLNMEPNNPACLLPQP